MDATSRGTVEPKDSSLSAWLSSRGEFTEMLHGWRGFSTSSFRETGFTSITDRDPQTSRSHLTLHGAEEASLIPPWSLANPSEKGNRDGDITGLMRRVTERRHVQASGTRTLR
ncbi:hypothetical protein CapIbe_011086 [Capra ibex]